MVNFTDLNRILKSEIFLYSDGQLRAVHIILKFELISSCFQISKHVIKAKDACLARIVCLKTPTHRNSFRGALCILGAQLIVEGEEPIPSEDEAKDQPKGAEEEDFQGVVHEEDFEVFYHPNVTVVMTTTSTLAVIAISANQ